MQQLLQMLFLELFVVDPLEIFVVLSCRFAKGLPVARSLASMSGQRDLVHSRTLAPKKAQNSPPSNREGFNAALPGARSRYAIYRRKNYDK